MNGKHDHERDSTRSLEDYLLTAATEASNRTRTIMLAMIVASVLALVSFLNTMNFKVSWLKSKRDKSNASMELKSWKLARLERIGDPESEYVRGKICPPDKPCNLRKKSPPSPTGAQQQSQAAEAQTTPEGLVTNEDADLRYRQFYAAAARDYIDNAFTVRVPFFGVAFDVNDLGLLMGIGFVAILLLLRFSIRSEIISLRVSFKSARDRSPEALKAFYDLLAMRQVFTLPRLKDEKLSSSHHGREEWSSHDPSWNVWVLRFTHKLICALPFLVYSVVTWHDLLSTREIGKSIDPDHLWVLGIYTISLEAIIFGLTLWCLWKLLEIDLIWDSYWSEVSSEGAGKLHGLYIRWKGSQRKHKKPRKNLDKGTTG